MVFKLAGFYCIDNVFPGIVIPVCIIAGGTHVTLKYLGEDKIEMESIPPSSRFIRLTPEQKKEISGFRPFKQKIFAYDEKMLQRYNKGNEKEFLLKLLDKPDLWKNNPVARERIQAVINKL